MSFPCGQCVASGREPPKQVRRKADICGTCRKEGPGELVMEPVKRLDAAELTDIADATIRLLAATAQRLEKVMMGTTAFSPTHASESVRLARGVAAALKEIRVVRESIVAKVEDFSDEDMRKTMNEWFKTLPRNQQEEMLRELVDHFRATKPGAPQKPEGHDA